MKKVRESFSLREGPIKKLYIGRLPVWYGKEKEETELSN